MNLGDRARAMPGRDSSAGDPGDQRQYAGSGQTVVALGRAVVSRVLGKPAEKPESAEPAVRPAEPAVLPVELPGLPQLKAWRLHGIFISFLLLVAIPALATTIYYYAFASDQYTSEFRFSVMQGNAVLPGMPATSVGSSSTGASPAPGGLASLLGATAGGTSSQNFLVVDYLTSKQALRDLQTRINIREMFTRSSIGWWDRFGADDRSDQEFAKYLQKFIYANYDQITNLAVVNVRAFTAADAELIAQTMRKQAETLVNNINDRANRDAIASAEKEDARWEESLRKATYELAKYRYGKNLINPYSGDVSSNVQVAQGLLTNLVNLKTQLASAMNQDASENSPTVRNLKAQIKAASDELKKIQGDAGALADVVAKYDTLVFDQQYAQTMVSQTRAALALARANAAVQHLYIEPYVTPEYPDRPSYPNRPVAILLAIAAIFGFWFAGVMIYLAIKDHTA
ncbi:MAG: hypothetical protein QM651_09355 [Rhodoblastus sp.]